MRGTTWRLIWSTIAQGSTDSHEVRLSSAILRALMVFKSLSVKLMKRAVVSCMASKFVRTTNSSNKLPEPSSGRKTFDVPSVTFPLPLNMADPLAEAPSPLKLNSPRETGRKREPPVRVKLTAPLNSELSVKQE